MLFTSEIAFMMFAINENDHVCFKVFYSKQILRNFHHQLGSCKSCTAVSALSVLLTEEIISSSLGFSFINSCCKWDAPQWIKKQRTSVWIFITSILAQTFNELASLRSELLAFLRCSTDGIPAVLQKPWLRSRTFLHQGVSVSRWILHSRKPEARRGNAAPSKVPGPFSVS